jgi:hypothetical protein
MLMIMEENDFGHYLRRLSCFYCNDITEMNTSYLIWTILLATVLASCIFKKKDMAPDKNYYFSIEIPPNNGKAEMIRDFLSTSIPTKKYTITNSSGMHWPYYQSFDLEEEVNPDSLMPPHWFVHRMVLNKQSDTIPIGDNFVRIEICPRTDTLLNYNVSVFAMKNHGLEMTATSGIHFLDTCRHTTNDMLQLLQQSMLRYSFK